MGLSSGDKLGSYEIVAPLGAGGMGEVYRSRTDQAKIMVANVFQNDRPQLRSQEGVLDLGNGIWTCDLAPDGKRFAVLRNPETLSNTLKNDKLVLILNATDELRRVTAASKPK